MFASHSYDPNLVFTRSTMIVTYQTFQQRNNILKYHLNFAIYQQFNLSVYKFDYFYLGLFFGTTM